MKRKSRTTLLVLAAVFSILAIAIPGNAATQDEINNAIDNGTAWLAAQQNPDGSWGTWYPVAQTSLAVVKLAEHAVDARYGYGLPSPFDPTYPYADNVSRGLDYIFANAHIISISNQTAGNPDTNGNGTGVYFGWAKTYETGIAMMAIAASRSPDRVVNVPGSAVNGWKYKDVLQDAVDYLAFGQSDSGCSARGGWNYDETNNYCSRSDNSNSGWATFGLGFAESPAYGFRSTIPTFVKTELSIWIDYIQNDVGVGDPSLDGGSGYDSPDSWVNILKTGHLLFEMALVDDNKTTPRVVNAASYLVRHWNDTNNDPGWNGTPVANYHATFNVMKGLYGLDIHTIDGINWQADFENVLVAQQNADGSWPTSYWDYGGDRILSTEWALLTLQKVAPPPVAVIGNVTGGGWIPIQVVGKGKSPGKATFGFVAHYADGAAMPSGNLEYNDHVAGIKVHGNVTTLSVNKATNTAVFSGTAKITSATGTMVGTYTATAVDNGEPGKNDIFGITLSTGYAAGPATLGGGNIQLHDP